MIAYRAAMLDPSIIEAMSYAQAFRAPAVIRDVSDATGEIETFRATELEVLARDRRATDEWVRQGLVLRDKLWATCIENPQKATASLPGFRQFVELTERTLRDDAKELRRQVRKNRKLVQRAFRTSPQRGAVMRELAEALEAILLRRYDEKLDFSAFVRALIAEYDPEARKGPVFDSIEELDSYLKAAA